MNRRHIHHPAVVAATAATLPPVPTFVRLPKPGTRCPYTGLSRTTLAELTRPVPRNGYRPPVPAREIKDKGARRGIVLIPLQELLVYLDGLPGPTRTSPEVTP